MNMLFKKYSNQVCKTRDHVEKSTLAARRLKNLAGNAQNRNESKINLDS